LGRPGTGLEPTKPLLGNAGFGAEPGMLPLPTGGVSGWTPLVAVVPLYCGLALGCAVSLAGAEV